MQNKRYSTPQLLITDLTEEIFLCSSFEDGDNITNPGDGWGSGSIEAPKDDWTGWH